jgi:hypothetical protein
VAECTNGRRRADKKHMSIETLSRQLSSLTLVRVEKLCQKANNFKNNLTSTKTLAKCYPAVANAAQRQPMQPASRACYIALSLAGACVRPHSRLVSSLAVVAVCSRSLLCRSGRPTSSCCCSRADVAGKHGMSRGVCQDWHTWDDQPTHRSLEENISGCWPSHDHERGSATFQALWQLQQLESSDMIRVVRMNVRRGNIHLLTSRLFHIRARNAVGQRLIEPGSGAAAAHRLSRLTLGAEAKL